MSADEIVKALRWLAKDTGFIFAAENLNDAADLIKSLQAENKALREASQKVLEGLQKLDSALDNTTCDGDALKACAEEAERRADAAVELVNRLEQALRVVFGATDYIKPNTGVWHTTGLALDWITEWRGPQEAEKGGKA